MQLEAGKKYADRRGRVYGPLVKTGEFFGECPGNRAWYGRGNVCIGESRPMDLVAEFAEPVKAAEPEYRLLTEGERIQEGDEYYSFYREWVKVLSGFGQAWKTAFYVPYRRPVKHEPAESPDDWVIQDRVPVRVGIDEFRYPKEPFSRAESSSNWTKNAFHGNAHGLEVRCRRKDLPPVPPKARKVVLKEWICWDDDCPDEAYVEWSVGSPTRETRKYFGCDHAVETGNTREVEIPVT